MTGAALLSKGAGELFRPHGSVVNVLRQGCLRHKIEMLFHALQNRIVELRPTVISSANTS
jgi:hypothetical protein